MKCTEIQNLLSAYYDDELSADLRENVDAHLNECNDCQPELASFGSLSSLTVALDKPETPASVWTAVESGLENEPTTRVEVATAPSRFSRRQIFQYAAAIAATLVVGFIGFELWYHSHDHEAMVEAMQQVARDINSDESKTLLLNRFGGGEVNYQDAITQVGFRPVASKSLPDGYSVESIQVLNMPCCKCTQTACLRPDNSRFYIYEHDNEETGWFEHQTKRQSECCGKTCEIVELDSSQLAVTWEKDNRHITMLGVRDEEEIELLVSQFEEKS